MTNIDFSIFTQAQQLRIATQHLSKGQTLFLQGGDAEKLFFVEEGCIRLVVFPQDSKQMVLYRAKARHLFAIEHLVLDRYSYSAIADQESTICSISKSDLKNLLCVNSKMARLIMECLCDQYTQLQSNFERLGINSAHERVLHFLNSCCDVQTGVIDLTGKLKSLSDDLNLSHEAVYRALRELESTGAIQRNGGIIKIPEKNGGL